MQMNRKQEELITVSISIYNTEHFLRESIESAIHQTYTNLEILLIDDDSSDGCLEICKEYEKQDQRIRVIHQENRGVSGTRNRGMDEAQGEYFIFLDGDDVAELNMIEKLYETINKDNTDMVICNFQLIDEEGKEIKGDSDNISTVDECLSRKEALQYLGKIKNMRYVVPWNRLYKKEIFKKVHFKQGVLQDDAFFAHHILGECNNISSINDYLYCYRIRETSVTQKAWTVRNLDFCEALFERAEFFYVNDMYDEFFRTVDFSLSNIYCFIEKLGTKDEIIRKRILELQEMYRKLFKNIKLKDVGISKKISFICFYINPFLFLNMHLIKNKILK